MRYYFQHNNSGNVVSYSESKLIAPNLNQIELDVSNTNLELIKQNYILLIKDNKLVFNKPDSIIKQEETEEWNQKIKKAKTIEDIKEIIIYLLTKK